jgi:hypothetical protein
MPAIPCGETPSISTPASTRWTTTPGSFSGLHVDRVELASGDPPPAAAGRAAQHVIAAGSSDLVVLGRPAVVLPEMPPNSRSRIDATE